MIAVSASLTYKLYGIWEVNGQILGIMIGNWNLQILDDARLLKLVRQVRCDIQHILELKFN